MSLDEKNKRIPVWSAYIIDGLTLPRFEYFDSYKTEVEFEKAKEFLLRDCAFFREELLADDLSRYLPSGAPVNLKDVDQFKTGLLNDGENNQFIPVNIEWINNIRYYVLATSNMKQPEGWNDLSDINVGIVINFNKS